MPFNKENFFVGARKGVIAKMTGTTSAVVYGTSYTLDVLNAANVTSEQVSDRLEGDDRRKALYSVTVGGTVQLDFAFKTLAVIATLFGTSIIDSGTYEQLPIDNTVHPYFGLCVSGVDQDGIVSADFWVPLVKIMGNIPMPINYGKYWRLSVPAEFIQCDDPRYPYDYDIIVHGSVVAPTIPPTYS